MQPLIGIGCDVVAGPPPASQLHLSYCEAVSRAGGVPMLLAPYRASAEAARALGAVDGLLLTGGDDYDPALYRQRRHPRHRPAHPLRQRSDVLAVRAALRSGLPLLGICNGLQLLNIALGGDLLQHIPDLVPGAHLHCAPSGGSPARHRVRIVSGTLLHALVGRPEVAVNTSHHQAVGRIGRGLRVAAVARDGVVEALEASTNGAPPRFLLGVQWHPERDRSAASGAIFEGFIEAARASRRAGRP